MTLELAQSKITEYYTLADFVERLRMRAGAHRSDSTDKLFVRAVQDAMRGVGKTLHDWSYYQRRLRIVTSLSISGAAIYDYTGGAAERIVTLTGPQTWPIDAIYGEVLIGDVPCRVATRISSTQITVNAMEAPTADYIGTVVWVRSAYPLPVRIQKAHALVNRSEGVYHLQYLSPADFFDRYAVSAQTIGAPFQFTIQSAGVVGESALVFYPSPTGGETYDMNATIHPAIPTVLDVHGSDGAITSGLKVFTSSEAVFTKKLVGCLLRISYDTEVPLGSASLHEWQAFIESVTNETTVVLSEAAPATYTSATYGISSPIDIDPDTMMAYFESECYAQYCRNHKHESLADAMRIMQMDLRDAIVQDQRIAAVRNANGFWGVPYGRVYTVSTTVDAGDINNLDGGTP